MVRKPNINYNPLKQNVSIPFRNLSKIKICAVIIPCCNNLTKKIKLITHNALYINRL